MCIAVHTKKEEYEEEVSIRIESEIIGTSHCCVCGTNKGVFRRFDTENLYPISVAFFLCDLTSIDSPERSAKKQFTTLETSRIDSFETLMTSVNERIKLETP